MNELNLRGGDSYVGLAEAKQIVLQRVGRMAPELRPLTACGGLVSASDSVSTVDSPSLDASLMDGYAVRASCVGPGGSGAEGFPVVGSAVAGAAWDGVLGERELVEITTGAPIPEGADAVVPSEDTRPGGDGRICVAGGVEPGANVLPRGTDNRVGDRLFPAGTVLTPGRLGRLAAAGMERLEVVPPPRVALIAVGDEVVAPGCPLGPGQLYASNLVTLAAWLDRLRIPHRTLVVPDGLGPLEEAVNDCVADNDALITSGGAWRSSRDLVVPFFEDRGWEPGFRRVRMGPGKGTAFGLDGGKPVFCLPGVPPSNETAFLELALPGLFAMAGRGERVFPEMEARYRGPARSVRDGDWTNLMRARLTRGEGGYVARVERTASRLDSIAGANCLVVHDESIGPLRDGDRVRARWILPGPVDVDKE